MNRSVGSFAQAQGISISEAIVLFVDPGGTFMIRSYSFGSRRMTRIITVWSSSQRTLRCQFGIRGRGSARTRSGGRSRKRTGGTGRPRGRTCSRRGGKGRGSTFSSDTGFGYHGGTSFVPPAPCPVSARPSVRSSSRPVSGRQLAASPSKPPPRSLWRTRTAARPDP
jgi:hypothetical protein